MFTIIASKPNAASMNIAQRLLENFDWKETQREFDGVPIREHNNIEFVFTETLHVFADNVDSLSTDCFIFVSSHKSEAGKPTLTVHAIGNWGKAELGGRDKTLVPTSAILNKALIVNLEKEAKKQGLEWPVVAEVDHHGPYLTKPTVFIEIGSTEKEWKNEKAAEAVARAILDSTRSGEKYKVAIGIGGPHYCPNFSKILLKTDIALGHIVPKYVLDSLEFGLFKQMVEKTAEPIDFVLIDWDGTNAKQRDKIISYCDELGLSHKRVKDFL